MYKAFVMRILKAYSIACAESESIHDIELACVCERDSCLCFSSVLSPCVHEHGNIVWWANETPHALSGEAQCGLLVKHVR